MSIPAFSWKIVDGHVVGIAYATETESFPDVMRPLMTEYYRNQVVRVKPLRYILVNLITLLTDGTIRIHHARASAHSPGETIALYADQLSRLPQWFFPFRVMIAGLPVNPITQRLLLNLLALTSHLPPSLIDQFQRFLGAIVGYEHTVPCDARRVIFDWISTGSPKSEVIGCCFPTEDFWMAPELSPLMTAFRRSSHPRTIELFEELLLLTALFRDGEVVYYGVINHYQLDPVTVPSSRVPKRGWSEIQHELRHQIATSSLLPLAARLLRRLVGAITVYDATPGRKPMARSVGDLIAITATHWHGQRSMVLMPESDRSFAPSLPPSAPLLSSASVPPPSILTPLDEPLDERDRGSEGRMGVPLEMTGGRRWEERVLDKFSLSRRSS